MSTTIQYTLPHIGREDIINQVLERLQRPDDVRNHPAKFIQPGFYSLAGTGKSRLLREIAERAKVITPYVITLDFDTRSGFTAPGTPLKLVQHIVDTLEESDRAFLPSWRRIFWRWLNPFKRCRSVIDHANTNSVTQIIQLASTQASNITQSLDLGTSVPANLCQAFQNALLNLHARIRPKVVFGTFSQSKRLPLIMILLDTVELAPKPIREWLSEIRTLPGSLNTLYVHMVVVFAGRFRQAGVLETSLPPLPSSDAGS